MSGYWWVRSGSATGDNIFDLVEESSLVGIGWPRVGDIGKMDFKDIRAEVHKFYPDSDPRVTGMLHAFAKKIQIGDIVLTAKPHDRLVLIGQVTGEYEFSSNPEHHLPPHIHRVEWLRTDVSYDDYNDAFENNGKKPAWGQLTVWNADQYADEINRLLAGTTEADDDDPMLVDVDSDADTGSRFGLERDLQDALKNNLHQLELGLKLLGTEQRVAAGRLDIAAIDSEGSIVVIELKAGTAQPESMTQLLAYMGTVDNPENRPVRGFLVANGFHPRLRHAAKAVSNIALRAYSFTFSFGDVERDE
ncbi:MAG: endonuclease NucS [Chloroflexi bacterium]|nr:endonuclease NucS [Chloroflexota bacterium]